MSAAKRGGLGRLSGMLGATPFTASRRVNDVVASIGRTEDLSFSPSNRRLAVAAFTRNRIVVFDIEITASAGGVRIALTGGLDLSSPLLRHPHGVDFLDDDAVIVTNRDGDAVTLAVPPGQPDVPAVDAPPIATWPAGPSKLLYAPGSVRVSGDGNACEVLICNNDAHTITRHVLDRRTGGEPMRSEVLLRKYLDVPDGVNLSHDRRWIAVSNHTSHDVLVYENSPSLGADAEPHGILRGVCYPHGLCFTADGQHLLVADAGAPFIHVFERGADEWRGVRFAKASVRIIDPDVFSRGAYSPEEGGPKGLDIDATSSVVGVTSEGLPLAFFHLPALLEHAEATQSTLDQEARNFRHALWLAEATHLLATRARDNGALVRYLRGSWSWRITEPLRWIDSAWRRRE